MKLHVAAEGCVVVTVSTSSLGCVIVTVSTSSSGCEELVDTVSTSSSNQPVRAAGITVSKCLVVDTCKNTCCLFSFLQVIRNTLWALRCQH